MIVSFYSKVILGAGTVPTPIRQKKKKDDVDVMEANKRMRRGLILSR